MLIDTHAHLDFENYNDIDSVLFQMKEAGVEKAIIPGVEPSTFERIINLIEKHLELYACMGIHPSETEHFSNDDYKKVYEFAQHDKVVAIGEIGLDYYWDKTFVDKQKEAFKAQIEIANILKLPVVVHDRDAHKDTFDILKENKPVSTIMHCFSGSADFAKMCIKEGFYVALGGVVTFKNARKMKEVAAAVPLENLLLETDSPYLTPHPFRGEENHPKFIKLIASQIAQIKDITYNEVAKATTENAQKVFFERKKL